MIEIPADWIEVACPACGNSFQVPPSLKSGIANCPACKKAVDVPRGFDLGLALVAGLGLLGVALAAWIAYGLSGVLAAAVVGGVALLLLAALLIAS